LTPTEPFFNPAAAGVLLVAASLLRRLLTPGFWLLAPLFELLELPKPRAYDYDAYDQTDQLPPHPPFATIWLRIVSRGDESQTKHEFRNRLFL
jgi:hypothetical protein